MTKRILICDDEFDVTQLVKTRLEPEGYSVLIAADGVQSVSVANRERPDLIILDIKMPAGDGYSVFENLKKSVRTMNIPVIFFSALPEAQVKQKAEELGAAGYIAKPYEPEELIGKVKKLLDVAQSSEKDRK